MAHVTSDGTLVAGPFKNRNSARRRGLSRRQREDLVAGLLFVAPAVLGFVLLKVVPILASFGIALTDWDVAGSPHWVGPENFRKMLFDDTLFWKSLWVTGFYTALSVPVSMAFAFWLASLLNKRIPGLGIFRTIFYLPSLIPVIATSILWLWMYNPDFGLFNVALRLVGVGKQKWIYSEWEVIPALVFMSMWSVGPMMIIFLAGLQAAAALRGRGYRRRQRLAQAALRDAADDDADDPVQPADQHGRVAANFHPAFRHDGRRY